MTFLSPSLLKAQQLIIRETDFSRHKAADGFIWASLRLEWSQNNYKLSSVTLELSGSQREQGEQTNTKRAVSAYAQTSRSILIVEDNPANQKVLIMQLKHLGFEADVVASGQAAIEKLTNNEHGYKLVLMDVQMPGMDGLTATRMIRDWENAQNSHVRIVAVTAGAMPEDRQNCLSAGMDDFLTKPLRLDALRQLVAFLGGQ